MIDYQENYEKTSYKLGNKNIPNDPENSDYIKMQQEIADGKAQIVVCDCDAIDAQVAAASLIEDSKKYLSETDWMVIREAEGGTAIPQAVKDLRTQARNDANEV